jgi:hypothetical protein
VQLGFQGLDSLAQRPVTIACHQEAVTLQLRHGNQMAAVANLRRQGPSPNAGANRILREAGQLGGSGYVNGWWI